MSEPASQEPQPSFSSDKRWTVGVLALFGLFFAANGMILYVANSGRPSEVVAKDPYESGSHYEETMEEAAATRATGWRYAFHPCKGGGLCVDLTGQNGEPLEGAEGEALLLRPSDSSMDQKFPLAAQAVPGLYQVSPPLAPGFWEVTINVRKGDSRAKWTHRLTYKP